MRPRNPSRTSTLLTRTSTVYYALRYCKKTRPGTPWHQKLDFMSLALISVGTCSAAFHGTMRLIPQLFDDMSMFLLAGALLQPIYAQNQPPAVRRLVTAAIVLAIGGVAVVYVRSGDILIHTVAFISMITLMWPRALYLIHRMGRAEAEKRRMMTTFKRSLWTLALGYGLWHVDLELCLKLRAVKEVVGVPLSWILELHGWWHFLTALGASHFIRLVRMITNDGGEPAKKRL